MPSLVPYIPLNYSQSHTAPPKYQKRPLRAPVSQLRNTELNYCNFNSGSHLTRYHASYQAVNYAFYYLCLLYSNNATPFFLSLLLKYMHAWPCCVVCNCSLFGFTTSYLSRFFCSATVSSSPNESLSSPSCTPPPPTVCLPSLR